MLLAVIQLVAGFLLLVWGAEQLGVSQVHVSRTLTRTLAAIRDHVMNDAPLPESWAPERVPAGAMPA